MALFTDGPPASIDDLSAQDSQLLTVANVEGIDVTQKLLLAWDELGAELYSELSLYGTRSGCWQPPRPHVDTVVVTLPLRLWHAFRALEMVYEDAYNSQLNDRYAGKRDRFHDRAGYAREWLFDAGVGIAAVPVARAAKATVNAAPPPGLPLADGTYYVTTAWVNCNGEEGASGDPVDLTIASSTLAVQAGAQPANGIEWNVYAGPDPNGMTLQNTSPLAIGQTWIQPSPLTTGGRGPGSGQKETFLRVIPRVIRRG